MARSPEVRKTIEEGRIRAELLRRGARPNEQRERLRELAALDGEIAQIAEGGLSTVKPLARQRTVVAGGYAEDAGEDATLRRGSAATVAKRGEGRSSVEWIGRGSPGVRQAPQDHDGRGRFMRRGGQSPACAAMVIALSPELLDGASGS